MTRTLSIRLRILAACLTLTVITGALGLFALSSQMTISQLTLRMYDEAFMGVDFFRAANADFAALRSACLVGEPLGHLHTLAAKVVNKLNVAIAHATSPEARQLATTLRDRTDQLSSLMSDRASMRRSLDSIGPLFDVGGERFAQDGFAFRQQAEAVADQGLLMSELAIGASLIATLAITVTLSRSIVPPLRRATTIAREIARGNLANVITATGSLEMVQLLRALGTMQGALAERAAAAQQIEHMAHHDVLTGLANRLAFLKSMEAAFAQAAEQPFALLLLDLDCFKPVNDTLGHASGDHLLRQVAKRINGCLAQADFAARIGGDEFAIIHRNGSPQSSEQLARRLNAALSHPYDLSTGTVTIGASVGIKVWRDDHSIDSLLHSADAALYAAKNAGRGGWRNYDDCSACHVYATAV